MTEPAPLLLALACAGAVLGLTRPVLDRLPEPVGAPDKIPYAALGTRGSVFTVALLAGVLAWVAGRVLPVPVVPLWVVLGTAGLLLAAIDARTTWLPLRLTRAAWVLMAMAAVVGMILAGPPVASAVAQLVRTLVGALVAGACYLLIWVVTRGGFGFGDVRFAPLIGGATAAESTGLLVWALVLGSVVGGVVGAVRLIRRLGGSFAYAPSMLAGAYVAALVQWAAT